ncbi:MAG: MFS transporter [Clostridiales bacterium]|nr:MFS transporter [Clostridiales bacterium]
MNRKLNMDPLDLQSFLNGLVFFAPVALLVRTAAGVSLARFFRLEALLSLTVLLSEVPAGKLTDRIGLRNTLVLYQATLCLARVLLLLAYVRRSYPLFLAEAVVEGVAGSFSSGTQSAYLYRMFPGPAYLTKSARTANCGTVGFLLSTAAYAGLYRLAGLTGLLAATVLTGACGIAAALGIRREPPQPTAQEDGKPAAGALWAALCRREVVLVMVLLAALGVGRILINFFYADKLMACGVDETWLSPIILGLLRAGAGGRGAAGPAGPRPAPGRADGVSGAGRRGHGGVRPGGPGTLGRPADAGPASGAGRALLPAGGGAEPAGGRAGPGPAAG